MGWQNLGIEPIKAFDVTIGGVERTQPVVNSAEVKGDIEEIVTPNIVTSELNSYDESLYRSPESIDDETYSSIIKLLNQKSIDTKSWKLIGSGGQAKVYEGEKGLGNRVIRVEEINSEDARYLIEYLSEVEDLTKARAKNYKFSDIHSRIPKVTIPQALVPIFLNKEKIDEGNPNCKFAEVDDGFDIYFEGGKLFIKTTMPRYHTIPVEKKLKHYKNTAEFLDLTHSQNLAVIDLKDSNMMMDSNGNTVLIDAGMTYSLRGQFAQKRFSGTPTHLAPEQIKPKEKVNVNTAQYKLAIVIASELSKTTFSDSIPLPCFRGKGEQGHNKWASELLLMHLQGKAIIDQQFTKEVFKRILMSKYSHLNSGSAEAIVSTLQIMSNVDSADRYESCNKPVSMICNMVSGVES